MRLADRLDPSLPAGARIFPSCARLTIPHSPDETTERAGAS
jgi:hypothetical protein